MSEGRKLVATEQARTQTRRQIGAIPPRTDQAVEPALRGLRVRKRRIGIAVQHRSHTTSSLDYSQKPAGAEQRKCDQSSGLGVRLLLSAKLQVRTAAPAWVPLAVPPRDQTRNALSHNRFRLPDKSGLEYRDAHSPESRGHSIVEATSAVDHDPVPGRKSP